MLQGNLRYLHAYYKNPSALNLLLLRNQEGRLSKGRVIAFGLGCVLESIPYITISAVALSIFSSPMIMPLSTLSVVKIIVVNIASYYLSQCINNALMQKNCQFTIAMNRKNDRAYYNHPSRNEWSLALAERHVSIGIEQNKQFTSMFEVLPLPKSCRVLIRTYHESEYLENAYDRLEGLSKFYFAWGYDREKKLPFPQPTLEAKFFRRLRCLSLATLLIVRHYLRKIKPCKRREN